MSGAWSNDQLNALYIYNANTGALIMQVTADGLQYITASRMFTFNTAGLFIQPLPLDGSYLDLTTQANFGGLAFLQPSDSLVAGAVFTSAILYSSRQEALVAPTHTRPFLVLQSPAVNGLHTGQVICRGQDSASSTDDSYVELIGDQLYTNGSAVGMGWINNAQATNNFGPIGNTETIFIPAQSEVYKANHAYEVRVSGQFTISVSPNRPVFRMRQSADGSTDLGTQIYASGKPAVTTGMHDGGFTCKFKVGAADVTTFICLTMTSASAAFTVTALNNPPFQFDIYDIGAAANHPDAVAIA